jgi:hypothetical protein
MSDELPDVNGAPDPIEVGWVVTDPDGNVVDSGGVSEAHAVAWLGELIDNAKTEGDN